MMVLASRMALVFNIFSLIYLYLVPGLWLVFHAGARNCNCRLEFTALTEYHGG